MIDLGTLADGSYSYATALNARDQIVGASGTVAGISHAVIWRYR
jgi:hypothetical protein